MFRVITAISASGGRHPQTCSRLYSVTYLPTIEMMGEEEKEVTGS